MGCAGRGAWGWMGVGCVRGMDRVVEDVDVDDDEEQIQVSTFMLVIIIRVLYLF